MKLYSRIQGSGPAILVLHGLFGMSDNWITIGNNLAKKGFTTHLLDLRNHGRSSHADSHRYTDMCEDILLYLEQQHLDNVSIIGHSMGGKLGMIFGLLYPEKIRQLVVIDMAPSTYQENSNSYHANIIKTLLQIDLNNHSSRKTIREELLQKLHDLALVLFLSKNIGKDAKNRLHWKINLPVLQQFLQHLYIGLEELDIYAPSPVKTLFVKGNNSDYYQEKHEGDRLHFFPDSDLVGIDDAGHWLHSEQPDILLKIILQFFKKEGVKE